MNDYYNIVSDIISEAVKRHHKNVEDFVLKELSKKGYNFDSYEMRNLFAQQRLTIVIKDGTKWLYLDGHILITAWKEVIDDNMGGWMV